MSTVWQNVTTESGSWRLALYGDIIADPNTLRTVVIAEPITADGKLREIVVNGVKYNGSLYFAHRIVDDFLVMESRHLTRYNDRARRWDSLSPAAYKRLSAELTPAARSLLADPESVTAAAIASARDAYEYALVDINREIDKANVIAARLRELGATVFTLHRHGVHLADCGMEFETAEDARDHAATCGACAGAAEIEYGD